MDDKMLCFMIFLSSNMWHDSVTRPSSTGQKFHTTLPTDKKVWDECIEAAVRNGFNSILVDVGDGIVYKSHPEIAVEGAWTPEFMNTEVKRLKSMGLKVYPKLNFSACHDAWLGEYGRMLLKRFVKFLKDLNFSILDLMRKTPNSRKNLIM